MTPPRPRALGAAVALALSVAGGLAGCGAAESDGSTDASESPTSPSADAVTSPTGSPSSAASGGTSPELARYYEQELTWSDCRSAFSCARLRVPLDYADPSGRSITLSVLKVPASGRGSRLGSLLVNPGGPGASGVQYAAGAPSAFGAALREAYDVVGFDPRGVGESTPLSCGTDEQLNALVDSDPDPDTAAEREELDRLVRDLGNRCLDDTGELARHVSTVEVARDVDILRAALGDDRLAYFGASYGTVIGAAYAQLFPQRVGRLVLDGAVDPSASTLEVNLVQARGFEVSLRAYVVSCVRTGGCFLGSSVEQGMRRIQSFLRSVQDQPLEASDGRWLTGGEAVYGVWYPLYDQKSWPLLDQALQSAFRGDGSFLLSVADAYLHRDGEERFEDNLFEAFHAINCLDRDDGVPSSRVARHLPRFEKASPTFGAIFAYSMAACDAWPIDSGRRPQPVQVSGSPPIMVVGTTRDPATPLVWARALAGQIDDSVLVVRDGDGHTGYRQGSACVDRAVEGYLVAGTVPSDEVSCS